jgi:lysine 2,3-aminomutase
MKSIKKSEKTLRKVSEIISHQLASPDSLNELEKVANQFSIAITPDMYHAIDKNNPEDPIKKQFIPSSEELKISSEESHDPIGDEKHTTVKGLIHRYPDRCLLMPVNVCPVYCRFCFRREKIGPGSDTLNASELKKTYDYIRSHPEIWEVILTGGDPLILKPMMLKKILQQLDEITTVEVIRIHTRVPVVDSKRINKELLKILKLKHKPVYIVLHANHPNEFTPAAIKAIASLVDSGIPMLSQSVLLKGINDNIETLSQLMKTMIKNRIKPYYLHHGDLAKGTSHFRTSIAAGQNLMRQLRGHYSGLCQPLYVLDIPGGHGKVPIQNSYIKKEKKSYLIEDYKDQTHVYMDDINLSSLRKLKADSEPSQGKLREKDIL